jgi:predicted transcriptional regulator
MKTLTEQFHTEVESFLERSGFKATEFGRQAAGDPSLVLNLRRGRSPTLATADRILSFVRRHEFLTVGAESVENSDEGSCGDER